MAPALLHLALPAACVRHDQILTVGGPAPVKLGRVREMLAQQVTAVARRLVVVLLLSSSRLLVCPGRRRGKAPIGGGLNASRPKGEQQEQSHA